VISAAFLVDHERPRAAHKFALFV